MIKATRCRLWALLTLLLVFAWSTSTFYLVEVKTPWGFAVGLVRGRAYVDEAEYHTRWDYRLRAPPSSRPPGIFSVNGHFTWSRVISRTSGYLTLIPLWPFFLVTGAAWALTHERKPADDVCPHCRYPRIIGRGLSPICPECGQPLPNPPQPR